jgi:uncharacterized BrkB/YihY/UPF0761 family membrane protein
MDLATERRLLQIAIGIGCLVPILAGGAGMLWGPQIGEASGPVPADLDSHMRYLSGLLFAIGIGFASCIPKIEERSARFRLLGAIVLIGGAGRAFSLFDVGLPGLGHRLALGMELGTVPMLMLWQWRVARLVRRGGPESLKSQGAAGPKSSDPSPWPAIGSDRPEDSGKTSLSSSERT